MEYLMQGWLLIRWPLGSNWRKYWCSTSEGKLSCFFDPSLEHLVVTLDIRGCHAHLLDISDENLSCDFCVILGSDSRVVFGCDSAAERESWLNAFVTASSRNIDQEPGISLLFTYDMETDELHTILSVAVPPPVTTETGLVNDYASVMLLLHEQTPLQDSRTLTSTTTTSTTTSATASNDVSLSASEIHQARTLANSEDESDLPTATGTSISLDVSVAMLQLKKVEQRLQRSQEQVRRSALQAWIWRHLAAKRKATNVKLEAAVSRSSQVISQLLDRHTAAMHRYQGDETALQEFENEKRLWVRSQEKLRADLERAYAQLEQERYERQRAESMVDAMESVALRAQQACEQQETIAMEMRDALAAASATRDSYIDRVNRLEMYSNALKEERVMAQIERDSLLSQLDNERAKNAHMQDEVHKLKTREQDYLKMQAELSSSKMELISLRSEARRRDLQSAIGRKLAEQRQIGDRSSVQSSPSPATALEIIQRYKQQIERPRTAEPSVGDVLAPPSYRSPPPEHYDEARFSPPTVDDPVRHAALMKQRVSEVRMSVPKLQLGVLGTGQLDHDMNRDIVSARHVRPARDVPVQMYYSPRVNNLDS